MGTSTQLSVDIPIFAEEMSYKKVIFVHWGPGNERLPSYKFILFRKQ